MERIPAGPVRVGFDVDDTLIDHVGRVRRHTREVFADLAGRGFALFVWSGAGTRWEVVDMHGLRPYVIGCYRKPISRHHERLAEHGVPFVPDFVIDDDLEVVEAFGGFHIPVPAHGFADDPGMLQAHAAVLQHFAGRVPALPR